MDKEEMSKVLGISEEEFENIIKAISEAVRRIKEIATITFNRFKEILVKEIDRENKRKKYMRRVRNRNNLYQKRLKKYGRY